MFSSLPATVGTRVEDIDTPALLLDLDAYEHNLDYMAKFVKDHGVRLRVHAKCHKSADIAQDQIKRGAVGVCCQKVSEAEAMFQGGVRDLMVSNEVVNPHMIERMAAMAKEARVLVCVDDIDNIDALEAAAARYDSTLEVLVEVDCGANRCGVAPGAAVIPLAQKIAGSPHLKFAGLQAYQGSAQHKRDYAERKELIDKAAQMIKDTVAELSKANLHCDIIAGAGTGTYMFEGTSGVWNELECGSYVFMDADYQRDKDPNGAFISEFKNSLFILTTVMSKTKAARAVCDAGLKAQSVDSGLPVVFGRNDIEYVGASDEHGIISDPHNKCRLGEKIKLIPGHCDPTVNVYDWMVGIRNGIVERVFPVTARGMSL